MLVCLESSLEKICSSIHNRTRFASIPAEETNYQSIHIVILICEGSVSEDHCCSKDSCNCNMLAHGCPVLGFLAGMLTATVDQRTWPRET